MTCQSLAHNGNDYTIIAETPDMYASSSVSDFIKQEVARPSKQWISHIIDGKQETEEVIRRTEHYVLLPDTERVNRYARDGRGGAARTHQLKRSLNWLAIASDKNIRTMRDLRGTHLDMLKNLLSSCLQAVENETGIRAEQVMAYVHYPPSVYQLHVHFSYPYGQYCHRDAYRVHNLATVINNLEIDPLYYTKATLYMTLFPASPHYTALFNAIRDQATKTHTKKKEVESTLAEPIPA